MVGYIIRSLCLLLLLVSSVQSECERGGTCNDADKLLADNTNIFYWLAATLGILFPPVLLWITWRKQLAVLQQVEVTKGGPAVMWACIA